MQQYTVTGMSCAACSARVEKAVSSVAGVAMCSVNLLTNSMTVKGTATKESIISAVEAAGYHAAVKGTDSLKGQSGTGRDEKEKKETDLLRQRLMLSLFF